MGGLSSDAEEIVEVGLNSVLCFYLYDMHVIQAMKGSGMSLYVVLGYIRMLFLRVGSDKGYLYD